MNHTLALSHPIRWLLGLCIVVSGWSGVAWGQDDFDLQSEVRDSATQVLLPQTPIRTDAVLTARRAYTWVVDGTHYLHLDEEMAFAIGSYTMKADGALVVVTPTGVPNARTYHLELYLDEVSSIGGGSAIEGRASRLLVTASIAGEVKLMVDRMIDEPSETPLVLDGVERINRYRVGLVKNTVVMPSIPELDTNVATQRDAARQTLQSPRPAPTATPDTPPTTTTIPEPTPVVQPQPQPIQPTQPEPVVTVVPEPVVTPEQPVAEPEPQPTTDIPEVAQFVHFTAGKIVHREQDEESYTLLVGQVAVMYTDPQTGQAMTLTSDKAVVFSEPGSISGSTVPGAAVRGVYLEDNVMASNGQYTMRGPRLFFDVQNNRAIVLDTVFYTFNVDQQVPIYVRARKLMQVSEGEWKAERATLSTSEFAEPHLALGMNELTLTEEREPGQPVSHHYKANHVTGQMGNLPFFYWPHMAGEADEVPLDRIKVEYDSDDGLTLRTRWDAFALFGYDAPEGVDAKLQIDGYTSRGAAVGLNLDYDVPKAFGEFDSYLMYDAGEDDPGGRSEITPEDRTRAMVHWQHRHYLDRGWEASVELAYLLDDTFLEEFFPSDAYTDKTWETSLYLKKQEEDWAFTFLTKWDLLDFTPQLTQLQTPGYTVNKFPEAEYYRVGTPLFDNRVTWFSENRGSVMRLNLPEQTPKDLGFSAADSVAIFGMTNTMAFDSALRAAGYNEDTVYRADTRQELNAPFKLGPIDVVPYVVGRATVYDESFNSFAGEDDSYRLWAMGGVRLHTALHRTYRDASSKLLDIQGIRHIIEPSANLSYAWTTIDQEKLPVYDYDVESLTEGGTARLGLRQTFQTQRGGEGHWRSVDVFRLDTDFVIQDSATFSESPIARYVDYRPEYSQAGNHFHTEMAWQVTDSLASVANLNYSFDTSTVEQWNYGMTLEHNPRLVSFAQLRRNDSLNTLILRYGFDYLLSRKYHVSVSQSFDLKDDEASSVDVVITRRMPRMLLIVALSVDTVDNSTGIGFALSPEGSGGRAAPVNNPFIFTE